MTFIELLKFAPKDDEGRPLVKNAGGVEWTVLSTTGHSPNGPLLCRNKFSEEYFSADGKHRSGEPLCNLVPPADPYAKLREAQAAGKPVDWRDDDGDWHSNRQWSFTEPPDRYRIVEPEPEPECPKCAELRQELERSRAGIAIARDATASARANWTRLHEAFDEQARELAKLRAKLASIAAYAGKEAQ